MLLLAFGFNGKAREQFTPAQIKQPVVAIPGFNKQMITKKEVGMKITVLGGGLVGKAITLDLARETDWQITVADLRTEVTAELGKHPRINGIQADLRRSEIVKELVKNADLVIGALPGFMAFQMLQTVIEAEKNIVDISFFPENSLALDDLARKHGVTAIVDCGVAPGCSSLIAGHVTTELTRTHSFLCYVGGLPFKREWPFEYKVVFSPFDVIEEYTRPARYVEQRHLVTRPALSDVEFLHFPEIGTLEAFNSDGLRTLIDTLEIPNMKEKTLRYPGHAEKMRLLRETGFFDKTPLEINGAAISPLDFTARLLFPQLQLKPGEEDFTVMKIILEGERNHQKLRYEYDLFDRFDVATQTTSMARTTGYTAAVMARLVLDGTFRQPGVAPLEIVGQNHTAYQKLMAGLAARNVIYRETITEL
jgi:saccharopine dehydrogenase-like NADP-dependent oxidoreductase